MRQFIIATHYYGCTLYVEKIRENGYITTQNIDRAKRYDTLGSAQNEINKLLEHQLSKEYYAQQTPINHLYVSWTNN